MTKHELLRLGAYFREEAKNMDYHNSTVDELLTRIGEVLAKFANAPDNLPKD